MEKLSVGSRIRKGIARGLRHLFLILVLICAGCLVSGQRAGIHSIEVTSPSFSDGGQIPASCTCDGRNLSPALAWGVVPAGTGTLAILVTDPDAPGRTFIHWVVYNIPPATRALPGGGSGTALLPAGSVQGWNDFGQAGYGGPCPPAGKPHHYHFTVYALDSAVTLTGSRDGRVLLGAMQGHVLAQGEIVGIYGRG